MNKTKLYLGLVHYPVTNRLGELVTTSITNLDIHDISRSCLTFGVRQFFIINPLPTQKEFLERVTRFWNQEEAAAYNSHRVAALQLIQYATSIDMVITEIKNQEEISPVIVTTTAVERKSHLSFRNFLQIRGPVLLLLGTGYGLAPQVHDRADFILEPIRGVGDYNHLSVRSAAAIVLDRISSEK
ncbi:MAG: RNA methyltransferase [Candidatus Cloacimonetes bacterium]|nr:RNA methyltransferase [Candidatus Cloacimonadota bacterium]